ncbi:MAG: hypothetical protein C4290_00890 [Chloroflexota bacterium]
MEQDFSLDLDDVRQNFEAADVIALYFPLLRCTLLVDTRSSVLDPPMAKVVPMVRSVKERVEAMHRLRPRFGPPEAIALLAWPRYVAGVKAAGVWQLLSDRLLAAGADNAELMLERCYRYLLGAERAEFQRAIRGEGYRTLWQRARN